MLLKNTIYIVFSILALIICSPPPIPNPADIIVQNPPERMNKKNVFSSLKNLLEDDATLLTNNTTAIINFYEDYNIEEYQLILKASGDFANRKYSIKTSSKIIDISTSCKYLEIKKDIINRKDCIGSYTFIRKRRIKYY